MIKITREQRKSVVIRIDEALNIQVKAPKSMKEEDLMALLDEKQDKIHQLIQQKKAHQSASQWFEKKKLLYLGKYRDIIIKKKEVDYTTINLEDNDLIVTTWETDSEQIKASIETYLKKHLQTILEELTRKYTRQLNCNYNKITIRKQKTRWGSCSNKGNLSFNIRLIGAPIEVISYVVLHEVMHLKEFNHQNRFWEGIETIMPNYKIYQDYLKTHSSELQI